MDLEESIIQTRLPEGLTQKLKLHALEQKIKLKEDVAKIMQAFVLKQPWTSGTWIKQPKTTKEFKPLTVKLPVALGSLFEQTANTLEVSTSSLAYTAIDWYLTTQH